MTDPPKPIARTPEPSNPRALDPPDRRIRLFLSYARGDDEPFVRRLYARLVLEGFAVWWDRECMPSRALTFLKEIRDAIGESDRVVVVIGPKCVTSDYCRAEWQAALAESKVVNPVLRLGDHEDLPPELRAFHCPDFRRDDRFDAAFKETLRVLTEAVPPLGALVGGVPDLPPHFQPRPDDLSRLSARVLIDETQPVTLSGPERVTMLHGMGGAGKSVLAGTFARSTTTRRSFPHGIYWIHVGERGTNAIATGELSRLLALPPKPESDLAAATSQLTTALAGRSALVVLDNVWSVEQIEPIIDALGAGCRALVTTRLGELATAIGCPAVGIGELAESAALQHLADWSEVAPELLPVEAREVAGECGYLPLALALNGAMHQQGVSWSDLLEALRAAELDYAEQRFKGYPHPTVVRSMQVSMDWLDRTDAASGARLRELAAFAADGPVPERAVAVLWGRTASLAPRHVSKVLVRLAGSAFIRLQGGGGDRRVVVHDLQRDYLDRITDGEQLNATLLAAYEHHSGGDWARVPADGYIHRHLVDHLLRGNRTNAVHALFNGSTAAGQNAWFEANVAAENVAGYLADLGRLEAETSAEPAWVPLALIRVSVESIHAATPHELHAALLARDETSAATALAGALSIEDPEARVMAILALVPALPEARRKEAVERCLATVRSRGNQVRARMLPRIAAHFPGAERSALAEEALTATRTVGIAAYRAAALGGLLCVVDEPRRSEVASEAAAALAASVPSAAFSEAAAAVLPHLPGLATELLGPARDIEEPFTRALALEAIVPYLPDDRRPSAALEGIAAFASSGANGLWIVISLARHIPGYDVDALLDRASTDARQVPALVDTVSKLFSGSRLEAALGRVAAAAGSFEEPSRTTTRIRMLQHHEPGSRAEKVGVLIRDADALPHLAWRREAYVELLPFATREQLSQLRRRFTVLDDAGDVLVSAAQLSVHGDEALRAAVFERIRPLPASRDTFVALAALAQARGDAHHAAVVDAAFALRDYLPYWRDLTEPLMACLPLFDAAQRHPMIEAGMHAALSVPGFMAEDAFVALSPVLSESDRERGYRCLLADAERLSQHRQAFFADGRQQFSDNSLALADTLAGIAPHLPDSVVPEALAMTNRMTPAARWLALGHLLPRMGTQEREQIEQEFVAFAATVALEGHSNERFPMAACRALGSAIPVLEPPRREVCEGLLRSLLFVVDPGFAPFLLDTLGDVIGRTDRLRLAMRAMQKPNIYTAVAVSRVMDAPKRWSMLLKAIEQVGPSTGAGSMQHVRQTIDALLQAPDDVRREAWDRARMKLHGNRAAAARYLVAVSPLGLSLGRHQTFSAAAGSLLTVQSWWP